MAISSIAIHKNLAVTSKQSLCKVKNNREVIAVPIYPVRTNEGAVRFTLMAFVMVYNKIGLEYFCLLVVQFVVFIMQKCA